MIKIFMENGFGRTVNCSFSMMTGTFEISFSGSSDTNYESIW